ncbi:MAG TPA: hypothetical protein VHY37_09595 [Tepidisphaeraceae bacterium]|jgi:TolA-binding protein|nr:hypothetical protein [Tepidisphaeraceae bacterium]
MHRNHRWLRRALVAALAGGAGALFVAPVLADSITVKSGTGQFTMNDTKVNRIQNDMVYFTSTTSDTEDSRPIASVVKFQVDDEPAFSAAEDAFSKGDWKTAADDYNKAISTTGQNWIKTRSSVRLMEAAAKSGDFQDAVKGFLAMADRDPALAASHRPDLSAAKAADIDSAIGLVNADLNGGNAKVEEQKILLPFLTELYTTKGDSASAQAALDKDVQIDPNAAKSPLVMRAQASMTLSQAGDDLKQSKFQAAENAIDSHQACFIDPTQQADALYALAQVKAGMAAKSNPDSLKDAAIAYMRVVAIFKDTDAKPHVADSLLKAAAINEQLNKPDEAMLLYKQVSTTFKDLDPQLAGLADADIQRLEAAKAH